MTFRSGSAAYTRPSSLSFVLDILCIYYTPISDGFILPLFYVDLCRFWPLSILTSGSSYFDLFRSGQKSVENDKLHRWMSDAHRGGRYYGNKLSIADKSAFFKLSANYRYRKEDIWELSKNYRYRKMCSQFHPINSIESTVPKTRKLNRRDQKETHYFHKKTSKGLS